MRAHDSALAPLFGPQAVHLHRFLFRLGIAAIQAFAYVFIFELFFAANQSLSKSIAGVAFLYALSQLLTLILTPLTGAFLRRGVKRMLGYSISLHALSIAFLALAFFPERGAENAFQAIAAFVILQGMARAMYWIPYKAGAAHEKPHPSATREILIAATPALIGLVIGAFAWFTPIVLMVVVIILLASAIPVMLMPQYHERFIWTYGRTLRELMSRSRRHDMIAALCDGMQGAGLLFVWPLAAFMLFDWSYATLGLVLSLSILLAATVKRLVHSIIVGLNVEHSRHVAALLVFSTWIMRIGAGTPVGVIAVESFYISGVRPLRFGIDPHGRDQAADHAHFIDEETALKEMAHAFGRALMAVCLAVLALLYFDAIAFIAVLALAGAASVASIYLTQRSLHDRL